MESDPDICPKRSYPQHGGLKIHALQRLSEVAYCEREYLNSRLGNTTQSRVQARGPENEELPTRRLVGSDDCVHSNSVESEQDER